MEKNIFDANLLPSELTFVGKQGYSYCYYPQQNEILVKWFNGIDFIDTLIELPNKTDKIENVVVTSQDTFIITNDNLYKCVLDLSDASKNKTHTSKNYSLLPQPRVEGKIRQIITHDTYAFILTEHGLYAYGDNSKGQLGLGHTNYCDQFTQVPNVIGHQIQKIISYDSGEFGEKRTFIIINNNLYACGNNSYYGLLGFNGNNICPVFTLVSKLPGIVKDVIPNKNATFVLTSQGLYACGSDQDILGFGQNFGQNMPTTLTRVPNLPNNIHQVVSSNSCTFVLTDQGLFACGKKSNNGLGPYYEQHNVFAPVSNVTGEIRQIVILDSEKNDSSCSTFILTDNGLFACGDNKSGELGLGHYNKCDVFTQVSTIQGKIHKIIKAKEDDYNLYLYVQSNHGLLTSGSNYHKYLRRFSSSYSYESGHCHTFKPVPGISGNHIKLLETNFIATNQGLFALKNKANEYSIFESVSLHNLRLPSTLFKKTIEALETQLIKEDLTSVVAAKLIINILKGDLNGIKTINTDYKIPENISLSLTKEYFSHPVFSSAGPIGLYLGIKKYSEIIEVITSQPLLKNCVGIVKQPIKINFSEFNRSSITMLQPETALTQLIFEKIQSLTPLELAILAQREDILLFLLKNKVNPNLTLPTNITNNSTLLPCLPIHLAVITKNLAAVRLLVEHGADIKAKIKIVCTNNDIFQGKFSFCRGEVRTGRFFSGYKYNNGVNVETETWIFDASLVALTLLFRNPNDPDDAEKTKKIAEFLCKQGANFNEKINAPRERDTKHFLRLDQLDSYGILPGIRNAIRAEKPKHTAKNDTAFFKQVDKINTTNSESEQIQHMQKQIDNLTNIVLTLQAEVNQLKQKLGGENNYSQVKFNRK